ncbi:DUF2752 domain-containing protein [Flexibacter flexilis]|nr:DUF2752 domain-containing protein [Flexibacter flexilis]
MLCGTQRATHELLHGHISASFAQNQWLWITAPYWAGLIGMPLLPVSWQNTNIATRLRRWATHPYTSWGVGILTVIFMLWRNLAL